MPSQLLPRLLGPPQPLPTPTPHLGPLPHQHLLPLNSWVPKSPSPHPSRIPGSHPTPPPDSPPSSPQMLGFLPSNPATPCRLPASWVTLMAPQASTSPPLPWTPGSLAHPIAGAGGAALQLGLQSRPLGPGGLKVSHKCPRLLQLRGLQQPLQCPQVPAQRLPQWWHWLAWSGGGHRQCPAQGGALGKREEGVRIHRPSQPRPQPPWALSQAPGCAPTPWPHPYPQLRPQSL